MTDRDQKRHDGIGMYERNADRIGRRRFLLAGLAGISTLLSGCSDQSPEEDEPQVENGTEVEDEGTDPAPDNDVQRPADLEEVREGLREAYQLLDAVPLARDGELDVDFDAYEEHFDFDAFDRYSEEALASLDELQEQDDTDRGELAELRFAAQLLPHLALVRNELYEYVAAYFVFEDRFYEGELDEAAVTVEDAGAYSDDLEARIPPLEEQLSVAVSEGVTFENFSPGALLDELRTVEDVLLWIVPVYDGFYDTFRGLYETDLGRTALSEDRFDEAVERYTRGREHLSEATDSLDSALGRGTRIERIELLTDLFRCILPSVIEFIDDVVPMIEDGRLEDPDWEAEPVLDIVEEIDEKFDRCAEALS